jgi:hypothetical protein
LHFSAKGMFANQLGPNSQNGQNLPIDREALAGDPG